MEVFGGCRRTSEKSAMSVVSEEHHQHQKEELLELTKAFRRRLMDKIRRNWRASFVDDPDMWGWAKRAMGDAFDRVWADIEHEMEKSLYSAVLPQEIHEDAEGPSGEGWFGVWCGVRAFVLFRIFPYNKSIFGSLKDPLFVLFFIMMMGCPVPFPGVRVAVFGILLCMLCFPGPADKFQCLNFILLFKWTQFWSSGYGTMFLGLMQYFTCYSWHKGKLLQCIESSGPGAGETFGALIDYLGNIVLGFIAFYQLTRRPERDSSECEQPPIEMDEGERNAARRLRTLMRYDAVCFTASLAMLVVLTFMTGIPSANQFQANVYICCVNYSLFMLPFIPFTFGSFQSLLIHVEPTGYNSKGACILYVLPVSQEPDQEEHEHHHKTLGLANRLLRFAKLGARKRRGESGEFQFNDIMRGAVAAAGAKIKNGFHARTDRMRGLRECLITKVEENTSLGKEARTGDAEHSYRFGDFTRGALWKAKHGSAAPTEEKKLKTLEDDKPHFVVASVQLPAEKMKDHKGTMYFCIDVCSREGEHRFVFREYKHFYALRNRLGPRAKHVTERAHFPGHRERFLLGARTQRREKLEHWLSTIIDSPYAKENPWAGLIRDFLSPESEEYNAAIDDENDSEELDDASEARPSAAQTGSNSALSETVVDVKPLIGLAGVQLPAEKVKDHKGTMYFCIDVCSREGEHWFVFREYNHFYAFRKRLGPRAKPVTENAHFPGHRERFVWGARTQRREKLERWLSTIIDSPYAKENPWAGLIRDFLSPESEEYNAAIDDGNDSEELGDARERRPTAAEICASLAYLGDLPPEEGSSEKSVDSATDIRLHKGGEKSVDSATDIRLHKGGETCQRHHIATPHASASKEQHLQSMLDSQELRRWQGWDSPDVV